MVTINEQLSGTAPRLAVRGLTKSFGSARVLDSIDLEIGDAEFIGLIGPNGAGKSTLIKILDGLYERDRGTVVIDGQPVEKLRGHASIRVIHQDLGLVEG